MIVRKKKIVIQGSEVEVFVAGEFLKRDENAVSVVGSRAMTERGKKLAYKFAFEFAKNGITVVSGLARGIDTVAHRAALDAGGRTIAVLAHGLDIIYPRENLRLASEIIRNGCLMTKFESGIRPLPKNFLARNQIVAGLSKAVLVIEGNRRSGTISTANHAANMGVEVFAIPGSPATDFLIENGANSVTSPPEMIKGFGVGL